jgi:hypothetical protein
MNWIERMIDLIPTWDSKLELPLGVYDYLERKQTEQDYYWEDDYV